MSKVTKDTKDTKDAKPIAKVTKLNVQATIAVERDGVVLSEGVGQPFVMFAGQLADFASLIASIEKAVNANPDAINALIEQGKPKA